MNNDVSDDCDDNDEECIQEMLGGAVDFAAEWVEEVEDTLNGDGGNSKHASSKITPGLVDPSSLHRQKARSVPSTTTSVKASRLNNFDTNDNASNDDDDEEEYGIMFQNAFQCSGYCTPHHKVERPPLRIHDYGHGRGRALMASRFIPKGEVMYTERAAVATQLPILEVAGRDIGKPRLQPPTRACQNCHRSMESWKKLIPKDNNSDGDECSFPFPEVWPVLPLEFSEEDIEGDVAINDKSTSIRKDRYGRVQCEDCEALFCSSSCYQTKLDTFGSCCLESRLLKDLPSLLREGEDDEDSPRIIQAPVVLAAVFFLQLTHYYRTHRNSLDGHWFHELCGDADDLQQLELGVRQVVNDEPNYTLKPLYDYLAQDLLHLEEEEKAVLSLKLLHSLATKAARNGVGFCTQSPFKAYYSGLLRQTNYGGRGSDAHNRIMQQLMTALGRDGLQRGMDRDIDALVAPEMKALFPLTACCNHSCEPNAQIQSQEFDDAHIDVVALADIPKGEEVCISYIGRRSNKFQRQKELRARYLFQCQCERCVNEGG